MGRLRWTKAERCNLFRSARSPAPPASRDLRVAESGGALHSADRVALDRTGIPTSAPPHGVPANAVLCAFAARTENFDKLKSMLVSGLRAAALLSRCRAYPWWTREHRRSFEETRSRTERLEARPLGIDDPASRSVRSNHALANTDVSFHRCREWSPVGSEVFAPSEGSLEVSACREPTKRVGADWSDPAPMTPGSDLP